MTACISSGYGSPRVMAPGESVPIFVSGKTVERWTVSDPAVASLEPDGYLHKLVGTRAGTVTVTASGEGFELHETFHVADLSKVEAVELVLQDKGHAPNAFELAAIAVHDHHYRRAVRSDPAVAWSSSDELVARFDASARGTLRGLGEGPVRVTIAFGGQTTSRDFHVEGGALSALDAPVPFGRVLVGVSKWLEVGRQSTDGGWSFDGKGADFTASPDGIVEITTRDGRSVVKGLRAGSVTIGARWRSLHREREVDVQALDLRLTPLRSNAGAPDLGILFLGESVEVYTGIVDPVSIDEALNIVWSSSPEGLLEMSGGGTCVNVKALLEGEATIRATYVPNGDTRELVLRLTERPEINWY